MNLAPSSDHDLSPSSVISQWRIAGTRLVCEARKGSQQLEPIREAPALCHTRYLFSFL
jgi:hypothetical protein